ncbi:MAG: hypothetical protein SV760_04845, partial [Halobacteria archaeon]|nr:hypothetical protein [Halobacteria archaeon]
DTVGRDFDGDGKNEKRTVDVSKIHPDLRSLHVWIHVDNPAGVFNPVNPEFTAEGAGHHGGGSDGGGNHSH